MEIYYADSDGGDCKRGRELRLLLAEMSGMFRTAIMDASAGRSRPHRKNQALPESILRKFTLPES